MQSAAFISEQQIVFRIILAAIMGGLIGLERESLNKSAGFRTHILVAVGSALIMIVSQEMFQIFKGTVMADPGRIAAQVVSGIGFIGAGTIMREGASVKGLTTAASLWVVAGVGLAVGSGLFFAAAATTGVVFITLIYLGKVEKTLASQDRLELLVMKVSDTPGQLGKIASYLGEHQINIQHLELKQSAFEGKMLIEIHAHVPVDVHLGTVLAGLTEMHGVHMVQVEE